MPGLRGLVLLTLCFNLRTCLALPNQRDDRRAEPPGPLSLPHPLLDLDGLIAELREGARRSGNRTEGVVGCEVCEPELCPENRGCRAGLVLDSCGCCMECGNLEGQVCDPGNRSVFYGLCGTGMRCQVDQRAARRRGGEEQEDEEEVCMCEEQEAVCGSDGVTYMNICQFREAAFSKTELRTRGRGPCKTGRTPVHLNSTCLLT